MPATSDVRRFSTDHTEGNQDHIRYQRPRTTQCARFLLRKGTQSSSSCCCLLLLLLLAPSALSRLRSRMCGQSGRRHPTSEERRLAPALVKVEGDGRHLAHHLLPRRPRHEAAALPGEPLEDLEPLPFEQVLALHLQSHRRLILGLRLRDERLRVVLGGPELPFALKDGHARVLLDLDAALVALNLRPRTDVLGLTVALGLRHLQVAL